MNLAEYVKNFPRNKRMMIRKRIAKALGVNEPYIRSMCNGNRKIQGKYAIAIEITTSGAVTRHEVNPDLYPLE